MQRQRKREEVEDQEEGSQATRGRNQMHGRSEWKQLKDIGQPNFKRGKVKKQQHGD